MILSLIAFNKLSLLEVKFLNNLKSWQLAIYLSFIYD